MYDNFLFTASFCIQSLCKENNPTSFVLGGKKSSSQIRPLRKIIIMSETRLLLDAFTTYTLILLLFQKGSKTIQSFLFKMFSIGIQGLPAVHLFQNLIHSPPTPENNSHLQLPIFFYFFSLLLLYLSKQLSMSPQAGYYLLSHLPLQLDQVFTVSIWLMSPSYLLI